MERFSAITVKQKRKTTTSFFSSDVDGGSECVKVDLSVIYAHTLSSYATHQVPSTSPHLVKIWEYMNRPTNSILKLGLKCNLFFRENEYLT